VQLVLILLVVAMVFAVYFEQLRAFLHFLLLVEARDERLFVYIVAALGDRVGQRLVVELLFYERVQSH
jgi:hypothetical protein